MMEHSKAYKEFILEKNSTRPDGYDSKLLELIYPHEREEIKGLIVDSFLKADFLLAKFLYHLKSYDGKKS